MSETKILPALPPGYQQLPEMPQAAVHALDTEGRVRWFNNKIAYLFDPNNPGFLAYMQQCRTQTKALAIELQKAFDKQGLNIWARGTGIPGGRRSSRIVNILIRPPYLSSRIPAQQKATERMQGNDRIDNFILHVDCDNRLQLVRFWKPEIEDGKEADDETSATHKFRMLMWLTLEKQRSFIESNYG